MTTISRETPQELFKELVETAMTHQKVASSEDSASYLVQLLAGFVRPDRLYARAGAVPAAPLGEIFWAALTREDGRQLALLKLAGDTALFVHGFCGESLRRSALGPAYYARLGGHAYGNMAALCQGRPTASLFDELAVNFLRFADVLSEVSESCTFPDDAGLLCLYEKWLRTGNASTARQLVRRGLVLDPEPESVQ